MNMSTPNEAIARKAAESYREAYNCMVKIEQLQPIILAAIEEANKNTENQAQGLAHILNDLVTLTEKRIGQFSNVKPSVQSTIAIARIQLKAFWAGERGTIDLQSPQRSPATAGSGKPMMTDGSRLNAL